MRASCLHAPDNILLSCHACARARRVSYSQERYMFHVLVQDGLCFMCMAEEVRGHALSSGGMGSGRV